jgi:diguanylate cyclase (GGDEF)-like protein
MPQNILILLAVLVAANAILISVVAVRSYAKRRSAASRHEPTPIGTPQPVPRGYIAAPPIDMSPAPGRTDPLTGMLLPGEWNRMVADEDARILRYGRPATIVLLELDGLDRLVAALGQEAGDRILPAMADTLSRQARGSDHIARLGPGRFGVLLPETGEVEAVNYVERVRQVCELWLESGAIALRLAIGWASPATDASLIGAYIEAQERLFVELRRGARRAADIKPEDQVPPHGFEEAASPA